MRIKERRDYWRGLVKKHVESGMSAAAFCKEQQIKLQQFHSWRRRFRHDTSTREFIRLVPTSKTSGSGIRIHLNHGIAVEVDKGFDPVTLREAIDVLCNRG